MSIWWWVRHGPTHVKTMTGWTDLPADLSDTAQIQRLASFLPDEALVVSSDLVRATATADAIQADRQRLSHTPDIREINLGDWEGKSFDEARETHPELIRNYWENPGDHAAPNGESWNDLTRRSSGFVQSINTNHPDQPIIAVAHMGVILAQIHNTTGMSASAAMSFRIDNFSVTRLEFLGDAWRVLGVNQQA